MKKILFSLFALMSALSVNAQQDAVLMTINGKPIMASEFMYIYEKNNQETTLDPKSMDEYLDLFINFKLKVIEAESQGIDTTEAFLKELKGYRAQATPKYMKDEAAVDSLIRMTYNHIAHDRRAAHIAIECHSDASDSAVAAALAQIEDIRIRVTEGKTITTKKGRKTITKKMPVEDFFAVAEEMSTDPSVRENRGELGWITPLRYVYPFENAVYNTPVGQVTPIFRSGYGFHIALVEEEMDHKEVKASHIMKMVPRGNDSIAAIKKAEIDGIYAQLTAGAPFAETAQTQSDDKGSAMRGGALGWFGRGQMVAPFEKAAFALKDSGDLSQPIRSNFGWHIILKEGERGILPYEEMKADLEKKVSRDERMTEADKSFLRKTRAEYQLPDSMDDAAVRQYADDHLEEKYEDLKNLVREYHDGILLFDVSLAEVWDKASQDTVGLQTYFAGHKKNYPWDAPKFKGYLVQCRDKATAKAAKAIISHAEPDSIESYLNKRLNLDSVTYVKFQRGLWKQGQVPAVDKFGFKQKKAEFTPSEEFPVVFCVGKVLKAPEEWSDERGKVTTDYQDYLEAEWIKTLRAKYPVVVDQTVFEELKK